MDTKKLDTGSRDAISYLPEEILGDILTLLPTKRAVSTSLLSKKWRNVFRLVPNLDFDGSVLLQPENGKRERGESFRDFLDRTQCDSPIKKFSLKRHIEDESEMDYASSWICHVVERGVLEVDISVNTCIGIFLPSQLFTSKTLVKLTLGTKLCLGKIPSDVVSLPSLKSLFIDTIFFEGDDLSYVLLAGCPVLEELFVRHKEYMGIPYWISSRTIKKLSVHNDCESEVDIMPGMSFEAPSLVSLDYSDYALNEYTPVNLESLVEARLDIRYSKMIERPDVSDLILGISNVETLHLSPASADVISRCVKRGLVLPVFSNLVNLSFGSKNKRGWKLLPYLLNQSPKLETLIIKDVDGYTTDVYISLNQVKVLRILGYRGTTQELERIKSFLRVTKCLELVRVEIAQGVVVDDGKLLQTHRDLKTLLGVSVSSKCKTEVAHFI